jgi:hypothetical protein
MSSVMSGLAEVGRVENSIGVFIVKVISVILVLVGAYLVVKKQNYKGGLICVAIGVGLWYLAGYSSRAVQQNNTFAALLGAEDILKF